MLIKKPDPIQGDRRQVHDGAVSLFKPSDELDILPGRPSVSAENDHTHGDDGQQNRYANSRQYGIHKSSLLPRVHATRRVLHAAEGSSRRGAVS